MRATLACIYLYVLFSLSPLAVSCEEPVPPLPPGEQNPHAADSQWLQRAAPVWDARASTYSALGRIQWLFSQVAPRLCSNPVFPSLLAPLLKDPLFAKFPEPPGTAEWRRGILPFIPCLLQQLSSPNPEVREVSQLLLDRAVDRSTVPSLLALLEARNDASPGRRWVRGALAIQFKEPTVTPYLLEVLEPPWQDWDSLDFDISLTGLCPKDQRLFDALCQIAIHPEFKGNANLLLEAILRQYPGPAGQEKGRAAFLRLARSVPPSEYLGQLAYHVASPDTFDVIARLIEYHPGLPENVHGRLLEALGKVGGQRYASFLRQDFRACCDEACRRLLVWLYFKYLEEPCRQSALEGGDVLSWIQREGGEMLPFASAQSLWPLLLASPDAQKGAPVERRLQFWKRALEIFAQQPDMERDIYHELYSVFGPEGLDEPESALQAIAAANDAAQRATNFAFKERYWKEEERNLQYRMILERVVQGLRLEDLHPARRSEPLGIWHALLRVPPGTPFDLTRGSTLAYLEVLSEEGSITLCPAKVSWKKRHGFGEDRLSLLLQPIGRISPPKSRLVAARIRLLFLPGTEGFHGAVVSGQVALGRAPAQKG